MRAILFAVAAFLLTARASCEESFQLRSRTLNDQVWSVRP